MAVNNLLDTSTVSLSDIIGNGKIYKVPSYQRDYSWKLDHWEDLWADIVTVLDGESVHYMGSIVLQNKGDKVYTVIDGQQRLATLTLIVLATIKIIQRLADENIDKENNLERIHLLSKKFLGDKDPGSLTYSAKLALNENNNSFFQSHLLVFRPPLNEKSLGDSDKLLWKSYNFFLDKISHYFKNNDIGENMANFLNKQVAEKLKFIQIVVENELSAYTVFETLNYRGERLTVSDLLKNFLFSLATTTDLEHVKDKWKKTVDIIGLDKFPAFLRHYWISKNKLISEKHLFKSLKESIQNSPQVIDLLDELEKNAQLYNALTNYTDKIWGGQRDITKRIREIDLFKEKQALPMLLASYNNLTQEEFVKVLKIVSIITFRYTIIGGLHTNIKEEIYNKASVKISNEELSTASAIAHEIKSLYTTDKDFKNDFSTTIINTKRGKKLARYILFELENHLSGHDDDFEVNPASIEHILPENADNLWLIEFPLSIQESFIYRLGNYTLLEEDKNRDCGSKSFNEKKLIYAASQYKLSNQINSPVWTPNTLDARQNKLADYASAVWRIPYYN
ncbi:MAG TPA: DUF262 domain-containing HNH endonuclease family protein [Saprospiraceae bacterium]|nr:DUF262 domain-containing HNH endonuclease family protein [Saprospiraceae bacterium]